MKTITKKLVFKNGQATTLTVLGKIMRGRSIVSSTPLALREVNALIGKEFGEVETYEPYWFEQPFDFSPNVVTDETTVEGQWDSLGICELI